MIHRLEVENTRLNSDLKPETQKTDMLKKDLQDSHKVCIQSHNKWKFTAPQIEYPLVGSNKKVVMYTSCWYICHCTTIATSDCTIVTSDHHSSIRTTFISNNSTIWQNNSITQKPCNRKYTWLPFLILPPCGHSIWGTENCQ